MELIARSVVEVDFQRLCEMRIWIVLCVWKLRDCRRKRSYIDQLIRRVEQ